MKAREIASIANSMHRRFVLYSIIYYLLPILLISYVAYSFSNVWLLAGIPAFYAGSFINKIIWLLVIVAFIIFTFYAGFSIHKNVSLYFLSLIFGHLLYEIPQATKALELKMKERLRQQTEKDVELMFTQKEGEQNKESN